MRFRAAVACYCGSRILQVCKCPKRRIDSAVLPHSDATAYADQLIALARRLSVGVKSVLLAMANRAELATRVDVMIDSCRPRGGGGVLACTAAAVVIITMSSLRMVAAPQSGSAQAAGRSAAVPGVAHYPTPDQPAGAARVTFDVVSIKPSSPGARGGGVQPMHGYQGYICNNTPLLTDMTVAYGVTPRQIQGGPSWMTSELFDIEAKSDQPHSIDELHLMLEHALEDRFQMKLHHQTRQETVIALKIGSGGIKFKEHEPPNDTNSPPMGLSGTPDKLELKGTNISMTYLAFFLTRLQPVPVLDQTGLSGHYDIDVTFQLPPPPDGGVAGDGGDGRRGGAPPDFSPLFEAMQQLGLRLDRGGKGPVDYLVIDSVQKPTGN